MEMVNLYKEEIPAELALAGQKCEPKIRDYVAQTYFKHKYISIDPKTCFFDEFNDPIYGGLIDAEPVNEKGEIDYSTGLPMFEIKTSSVDSFKYKCVNNQMEMITDHNGMPLVKEEGGKKKS
jgi:hypothetical protein